MLREPPFDAAAKAWLKRQIERGCSGREIADILFRQGFSVETVRAQMGGAYPVEMERSTERFELPPILRNPPNNLRRVDTPKLDLFVLEEFLGDKMCDQITGLIQHHLKPSPLAGETSDVNYRNSRTCFLSDLRSPVVEEVNDRICRTMGISAAYGEKIQVQHYDVGQQFKKHCDYFTAGSAYEQNGPEFGNRTWSFMVYLNEGM